MNNDTSPETAIRRSGKTRIPLTISRKIGLALLTLLIVSFIAFLATDLSGGNAARSALGRFATPQQVALFSRQQGLDLPSIERYWIWLQHLLQGNWGISLISHASTSSIVIPRLERTIALGAISLVVALPVAFAVGLIAARRPGGVADNILSASTLFVLGLPEFVVGVALLYLLAGWIHLLPPDSSALSLGSPGQKVEAFILPTLTLAAILTPYIARMVRGSVRDVLGAPYIQAAVMRGVSGWRLFVYHVMPNALGPVINVVALSLAEVLTGVVVVENVFSFPGIGQEMVVAISGDDVAVIQICVLVAATGFVVINFLADSLVIASNPRLRRRQS